MRRRWVQLVAVAALFAATRAFTTTTNNKNGNVLEDFGSFSEAAVNRNDGTPAFFFLDADEEEPLEAPGEGRSDKHQASRSSRRSVERMDSSLLEEPSLETYYDPAQTGAPGRMSPAFLTNTTWEEWSFFVESGIPVVVGDAFDDWPMRNWTCETLRRDYGTDKLYQEYVTEAPVLKPLGDAPWAQGSLKGPWYWDVSKEPSKFGAARRDFYWNRRQEHVGQLGFTGGEVWISRVGVGAKAHTDTHPCSTVSLMLSGRKRWRLKPLQGPVRSLALTPSLDDGDILPGLWQPQWDFVLEEGEALFMPPGMIHETTNVGEHDALSATFQFDDPGPSRYFAQFTPRMAFDKSQWAGHLERGSWVQLSMSVRVYSAKSARKAAKKLWRRLTRRTLTPDMATLESLVGEWSNEDVDDYFNRPVGSSGEPALRAAGVHSIARSALSYYDRNMDGRIDKEELTHGFLRWNGLARAQRAGLARMRSFHTRRRKSRCKHKHRAVRLAVVATDPQLPNAHASVRETLERLVSKLSAPCKSLHQETVRAIKDTTIKKEDGEGVTREKAKTRRNIDGAERRDEL